MAAFYFEVLRKDGTKEAFDCDRPTEGEALAYAMDKASSHGPDTLVIGFRPMIPSRVGIISDNRVTRHLTPEGVEYRAIDTEQTIARLSRVGNMWLVTPTIRVGIPRLAFKSQPAADAFAWVVNLERIGR